MASSSQVTSKKQSRPAAQIASMHQSMRSAMGANDLVKLRDILRARVLDQNTANTPLTDEERSVPIYKDILFYVCARYHTYNSQDSYDSYGVRYIYPEENAHIISILSVLMQHIFLSSEEQDGALLLGALEKSVEKLKEKSTPNNQISIELMPSILNHCSEGTLFEIFMNATPKLFANLLKKQEVLGKLPSGKQQSLLQTAIQENKLELAHLLIMLPKSSLFQSLDIDLKINFLKQAIEAENLCLVKDLLKPDISLVESLPQGSKAGLIEAAIHFKKLDLILILLEKFPLLFLAPLNNGNLTILNAAERDLWEIVTEIYAGCSKKLFSFQLESKDSYTAFLMALNANTEKSRAFAIKFAQEHRKFICKFYVSYEGNNTALHYAMKNGVKEVVEIILNNKNYTSKGAPIEAFVQRENSGEGEQLRKKYNLKNKPFTAIGLAAIEGKWDMVELHADLYKAKNIVEWNKLYSKIVVDAIQVGTPAALRAVVSLMKFEENKFHFNTTWIMQRIQDLIFDKKTNNLDINAVFYTLLESVASEERFELISELSEKVEISLFNQFVRKISYKPDDIKNNIVGLLQQINPSILRVDIILSFLINRPSPVWIGKEDKLHNGTRQKLIAMLNTDLKEILKMKNSLPEIKAIFDRVNTLLDTHSKEPKLTMEGFFSSTLHAVMTMRILKDFLGVVLGENPVLSFAEFQARTLKEQDAIKAEILSIYDGLMVEGPLNVVFCKNLFSFPQSAISHILQEHRAEVKNDSNCTETGNTGSSEKDRKSGEKSFYHSDPFVDASAPPLTFGEQLKDNDTSSDDDSPAAGAGALMVADSVRESYQVQGTSDGQTTVLVPCTPAVSSPTPSASLPQLDVTYPVYAPPSLTSPESESISPVASSSSGLSSPVGFFPPVPTIPVAVSSSLAMLPSVPTTPPQDRRATPPDSPQRKREERVPVFN